MYLRRSTAVKYVLLAFYGAVVYCEWFIYLAQRRKWTELNCSDHDTTCTKILFIGDPQILGDLEAKAPWRYIINKDSDRYLKSTFDAVARYFKPDILVYLGDLMDEGSIATLPQFQSYVKRLRDIFTWNYPVVQVWIQGDRDIGGHKPFFADLIDEFEKAFGQQSITTYFNISIYAVSAITRMFPQKADEPPGTENNFKIAVSHYPVTKNVIFSQEVINAINPQIFFCAHDHESKYVQQNKDVTNKTTSGFSARSPLNITFDVDSLYEIYVPTCSYRMGTNKVGYGAAVFENNHKNMRYTVFWSPERFPSLKLYLGILIILLGYCLVFRVARLFHRKLKPSAKSADMTPLLQRI